MSKRHEEEFHRSRNRNVNKYESCSTSMVIKKSHINIKMKYKFISTKLRKRSLTRPNFDGDVKQAEVFYVKHRRVKCTGIFGK